jgi:hypothetical protein
MPQVDVLLRILAVEVDVVGGLTQVWGARHARVSVGNIETARIANVPICVSLDGVGVRRLLVIVACSIMCRGAGECREANEPLTGWFDWGQDRQSVHRRWIAMRGSSSRRFAVVGGYASGRKPIPSSPDRTARAIGTAAVVSSVASNPTIADIECYRV